MKLNTKEFYGIEIEIKCKGLNSSRSNKADCVAVANLIAMMASAASDRYEEKGMTSISDWMQRLHNDLYEQLKDMGTYN